MLSMLNDTLTRAAASFPMLNTSAVIKPVSPTFSGAGRTEMLAELTSRSGPLAREEDELFKNEDGLAEPVKGSEQMRLMEIKMKKTGQYLHPSFLTFISFHLSTSGMVTVMENNM